MSLIIYVYNEILQGCFQKETCDQILLIFFHFLEQCPSQVIQHMSKYILYNEIKQMAYK